MLKHPLYDPNSFDYDIVIIRLEKSVIPSQSVQFACIPTADDLKSNFIITNTSGVSLGYVNYYNSINKTNLFLGDFDLNIVSMDNCSDQFPFTPDPTQLFCAGILVSFCTAFSDRFLTKFNGF